MVLRYSEVKTKPFRRIGSQPNHINNFK